MSTRSLFDHTSVGDLTLPNRVVMAPMSRIRADAGGLATPTMAAYYAQRSSAGLIISEGIQPSIVGQSNPGTPGLHTDEQVASWRQVTHAVHANGGRIIAQLQHGGRVSHHETTGVQPVAPSALRLDADVFTPTGPQPAPTPRAIETDEIAMHVEAHVEASTRAVAAGFDGVELHGANGYLMSQFLSSNINQRSDEYGGNVENRIRFVTEVARRTVEAIGSARVGIRLSPGGGLAGVVEDDALELNTALLAELARLDLAYVHLVATSDEATLVELRRVWPGQLIVNPSIPMVSKPADRTSADRWLAHGADMVSFGRAYISNPDLVERLRSGLPLAPDDELTWYGGGETGYLTYPTYQHAG